MSFESRMPPVLEKAQASTPTPRLEPEVAAARERHTLHSKTNTEEPYSNPILKRESQKAQQPVNIIDAPAEAKDKTKRLEELMSLDLKNVRDRCLRPLPTGEGARWTIDSHPYVHNEPQAFAALAVPFFQISRANPSWVVEVEGKALPGKDTNAVKTALSKFKEASIGLLDRRTLMYEMVRMVSRGELDPATVTVQYLPSKEAPLPKIVTREASPAQDSLPALEQKNPDTQKTDATKKEGMSTASFWGRMFGKK